MFFSAGCKPGSSGNPQPGLLQGKVTISPISPHETRGVTNEAGPEIYQAHQLVVLAPDGSGIVKQVTLDGKGYFKIEVPPGNYVLDVRPHDIGMKRGAVNKQVTIYPGKTTTQDIELDTGIR